MSDTEFFKLDQLQWYTEYLEAELSKNLGNTQAYIEKFEFDDVPY